MVEYIWSVWRAIQLGLSLHPEVASYGESFPNAPWIAFGVVMTAGISLLLGQSVILFLNQVPPGRFILSLVTNGLLLVAGWLFWSFSVWGIGRWLFPEEPPFGFVLVLIGLSYAPLVFGFLVLMPYLGPFIQQALYVWSFAVALQSVAIAFDVTFWPALLCVGLGWLALMVVTATIGRPIVALRNWIWKSVTTTQMDTPIHEVMKQFAYEQSASYTSSDQNSDQSAVQTTDVQTTEQAKERGDEP